MMIVLPIASFIAQCTVEVNQSESEFEARVRVFGKVRKWSEAGGFPVWVCCSHSDTYEVWLGSARDTLEPREFATIDAAWSTLSRTLPPGTALMLTVRSDLAR